LQGGSASSAVLIDGGVMLVSISLLTKGGYFDFRATLPAAARLSNGDPRQLGG